MRTSLLRVAALAALLMPVAAQAGDRQWQSVRVDVAALDLSTPAGMAELERRVARAVGRICADDRACREEAWASTEAQVAYAIRRDVYMRRMAAEREAQLRACGYGPCEAPQPVHYAPPPPPVPIHGGTTIITIVHTGPTPPQVYIQSAPPQQYWR